MIRKTITLGFAILLIGGMAFSGFAQYGRGQMGRGLGTGKGRGYCMGAGPGSGWRQNGMRPCAFNFNPASKATLSGTVEATNAVRGNGAPGFQLKLSNNSTVTVVASPFWASAGVDLAVGDSVDVVVFPPAAGTAQSNVYLAQSIRDLNTNGFIQLRNDDGIPVDRNGNAVYGGRFCPMNPNR